MKQDREKQFDIICNNVRSLYSEVPLKFHYANDEKYPVGLSYIKVFDMLFGIPEKGIGRFPDNLLNSTARTSEIGSDYHCAWHRRSLEDMFRLCKHYVKDASIHDMFIAAQSHLSSNFCSDTMLRVYKDKYYYNGKHHDFSSDCPYIFSLAMDIPEFPDQNHGIGGFDTIEEFSVILKQAEEWVIKQPDFAPVGRAYQKTESTQSH